MRKLASVQQIIKIEPIDGADRIEVATVLGWHVVVKKGEFQVGNLCVYFEIDSILPDDRPEFDFLKNSKGKMKPLKTKKLRGVISQGLVMPCTILPLGETFSLGQDVTNVLNVTKYEPPEVPFYKNFQPNLCKVGDFPYFIPKTDETRVQVLQEQLTKSKDHKFILTEKVDGTSFTAFIREGKFGICSRNLELSTEVESLYSDVAKKYDLKSKFEYLREYKIPYDFAIQGEIIGSGIQNNKYHLDGFKCLLFNFFNIDKQKDIGFYFSDDVEKQEFSGVNLGTIAYLLDMETVPVLNSDFDMIDDIDKLVDMSYGKSVLFDRNREGIVFRAKFNKELTKYGGRISFKAINPDFLLEK